MNRRPTTTSLVFAALMAGTTLSANAQGVTLTVWHNSQDPKATLDLYKAYEAKSGNTIELVSVPSDGFENATLTKWASGDRPDVLEFQATQAYISLLNPSEMLQDLSDMAFVAKSGALYDIGGRGRDGKVYAAITNFPEVWGLYYSKPVLDKYGFKPATTHEELLAQCEVLKKDGVPTLVEAGASAWPPLVFPFITTASLAGDDWVDSILTRKANIDDPDSPVLAGLKAYRDLIDRGCVNEDITSATFEDGVKRVFAGEAAYQAIHSNIAPVYLDQAGGDEAVLSEAVGFTSYGAEEQKTAIRPGVIGSYLLPKTGDEEREKAARDFVDFATGEYYPTYIMESGTFPLLEGASNPETASPLQLEIKAMYDNGPTVAMVNSKLPGGMSGTVPLLSELIVGQKTPEEMVALLRSQMESAAKAQRIEGWQ